MALACGVVMQPLQLRPAPDAARVLRGGLSWRVQDIRVSGANQGPWWDGGASYGCSDALPLVLTD